MKFKYLNESTVQPKTKEELQQIINETIEREGNECDLNFIDTSKIKDMSMLFWKIDKMDFNGDISNWDTSNVTNMAGLFWGCIRFNGDISKWDTSKVKKMSQMFYECKKFNQPLNDWDVSNVEDFSSMFEMCYAFDQPLNKWNLRNAKDISAMFYDCANFNQDLNDWDTSNIENFVSVLNKVPYTYALTNWDLSSTDLNHCKFIVSRRASPEMVSETKEAWKEQFEGKYKYSDILKFESNFVDR